MVKNSDKHVPEDFEEAMSEIASQDILSSHYREKKFRLWLIRSTLGAFFVYYFWERDWMSWALWVILVFSLISLTMIFLTPYILKKKVAKLKKKLLTQEDEGKEEE